MDWGITLKPRLYRSLEFGIICSFIETIATLFQKYASSEESEHFPHRRCNVQLFAANLTLYRMCFLRFSRFASCVTSLIKYRPKDTGKVDWVIRKFFLRVVTQTCSLLFIWRQSWGMTGNVVPSFCSLARSIVSDSVTASFFLDSKYTIRWFLSRSNNYIGEVVNKEIAMLNIVSDVRYINWACVEIYGKVAKKKDFPWEIAVEIQSDRNVQTLSYAIFFSIKRDFITSYFS